MKTILRLALITLAFASAGLLPAVAADSKTAAVQAVVEAARKATTPADREKLVQDAIAADPESAPQLVEALIAAFPAEAPTLTGVVVNSLIAMNIPTEAKATILTAVAQSAVNAALSIPTTAVPSLINTVNDVKAALANVGADPVLAAAVAAYTTPLTQLPPRTDTGGSLTNEEKKTDDISNPPTKDIVSDDNP
jgi:hypothetical protein